MATLTDEAKAYSGGMVKNIAELPQVSTNLQVETIKGVDSEGQEYAYKIIKLGSEAYRVPNSVLKNLKVILEDNPELKTFKVKKAGTGMDTTYTVIPLS